MFHEIPTLQNLQNISRNIFLNKCHQNNTKYFMKLLHKLFHNNISCFTQYILFLFTIFLVFHVFHMFAISFNYKTFHNIFTIRHVPQNILRKCFVKYCALISPKWHYYRNFSLLPAMLAGRMPIATRLTAASLSQS